MTARFVVIRGRRIAIRASGAVAALVLVLAIAPSASHARRPMPVVIAGTAPPAGALTTTAAVAPRTDTSAAMARPTGPRRSSSSLARILAGWPRVDHIRWPEGTEVVPFLNLEGIMMVEASVVGVDGRDTTGTFVVDTGAGYLALDHEMARRLGVIDSLPSSTEVDLAQRPLPRFALGALSMDQVDPVLTIDAGLVRRVTDRPVMGLLGQRPMMDRALWIDYQAGRLALVPSSRDDIEPASSAAEEGSRRGLFGLLSPRARALPIKLAGDGKAIVQARVSTPRPPRYTPWLNWIVDTGSSKTVLFTGALADLGRPERKWPILHGLSAPTLVGDARASVARIPAMELRGAPSATPRGLRSSGPRVDGSDVAIIGGDLERLLSRVAGEPIHGLVGYSTLKRYRVVLDYPRRILWLDPVPDYRDERPFEYSHVGVQIERQSGAIEIVGVAVGSPAARSGIAAGDVVVGLDGAPADSLGVLEVSRRLEGPPGTSVTLVTRRGELQRTIRLKRRRLL